MTEQTRPVWDIPVRLFHWALVILLAVSWWTAENGQMEWHYRAGYTLLALLIFRILWGFVGSSTARFAGFLRDPRAVFNYCRNLFRNTPNNTPPRHWGHNPLGGWSVLVLLALLLAQVLLGLFAEDVDGLAWGPLSNLVSFETARWAAETHESLFNLLLLFIALHIIAVLGYLIVKKDNLVGPMITGKRRVREAQPETSLIPAPLWLAGLIIIAAAGFVGWLVS